MVGKERKLYWKLQVCRLWSENTKCGIRGEAEVACTNEKEHVSTRKDSAVSIIKF